MSPDQVAVVLAGLILATGLLLVAVERLVVRVLDRHDDEMAMRERMVAAMKRSPGQSR